MPASMNRAQLLGHLGKDPESRTLQSGGKVVSFSLATSEKWKDRQSGEQKEATEWHRIVVFNDRLGEIAEKYLRKGSKVMVEGAIKTRKWTDQQGNDRYSTEVVLQAFGATLILLDSRDDDGERPARAREPEPAGASAGSYAAQSRGGGAPARTRGGPTWDASDLDDEIPF